MNYLGNKYKLLPQILNIFPKDINNFYDVFCGGLDVSLNVGANKIFANDKHEDLIWLYEEIRKYNSNTLGEELLQLDKTYFPMNEVDGKAIRSYDNPKTKEKFKELFESKKKVYYKLREEFNNGNHDFKILLLLILNSVGLVEYRVVNKYVTYTCGKARVNENVILTLNELSNKINYISFTSNDFRYIKDIEFNKNDFVYLDPPYLGTTQYKVRWYEKDEEDLYNILDYLNASGVKFALSNFADGINHTNEYLRKWCGKYNVHNLEDNHERLESISKKGKRQEILISNY